MMNDSARPKQVADYHLEMLDGELILYHLGQTKILYCNETASVIWHLCDGRQTVGEIITLLSNAYPEAAADIAPDVERTLEEFLAAGSIVLT